MAPWVLGIDGGGTGTVARAQRLGVPPLTARGGPLNLFTNSPAQVIETLAETAGALFAQMGGAAQCASVAVGTAGVSHQDAGGIIGEGLRRAGYEGPLLLVIDMETALWGALPGGVGAILLSGTGSFCYGRNARGDFRLVGGGGQLVDDEGSAYALGRDVLMRAFQEWDGRQPPSLLPALLREATGITDYQSLVDFVYAPDTNKRDIAALAPLVGKGCAAGDKASLAIARKAGLRLSQLVFPLLEDASFQPLTLSMLGGVLLGSPEVRDFTREYLLRHCPDLRLEEPAGEGVDGAVLLASRLLATPEFELRSPFSQRVRVLQEG